MIGGIAPLGQLARSDCGSNLRIVERSAAHRIGRLGSIFDVGAASGRVFAVGRLAVRDAPLTVGRAEIDARFQPAEPVCFVIKSTCLLLRLDLALTGCRAERLSQIAEGDRVSLPLTAPSTMAG